jgi:orotate phosphoribosyltransferase
VRFSAKDHERLQLAQFLCQRAYLREQTPRFLLTSGDLSSNYFDSYAIAGLAVALPIIGRVVLREVLAACARVPAACGGPMHAAGPICQAVAHESLSDSPTPIDAFFVRLRRKRHGTRNWIECCPPRGSSIVVLDDVVVTGKSALHAISHCRGEGLNVLGFFALVDRALGGLDRIRRVLPNEPAAAIFKKDELDDLIASNNIIKAPRKQTRSLRQSIRT